MRFKAKNGAIREQIAPVRANQITGTTSDFKMGVIKEIKPFGRLVCRLIMSAAKIL